MSKTDTSKSLIRILQIRFVLIATAAALLVLAAAIGFLNIHNVRNEKKTVNSILDILEMYEGHLPEDLDTNQVKIIYQNQVKEMGPEYIHQISYFSILLSDENEITSYDLEHVYAVTKDDLSDVVQRVLNKRGNSGTFSLDEGEYAYRVISKDDDSKLLIVYDWSNQYRSQRFLMWQSMKYGTIALIIFAMFVSFFSKRALKTIIQNIESQKRFITNAGHELKTPIAVISANLDVLELTSGKNEWIESIRKQTGRLTTLINRLIRLSKLGEQNKLQTEPVNFSELVKNSVDSFQPLAQNSNVHLTNELASDCIIQSDPMLIEEVTSILIENACKYCDPAGEIKVTLEKKKQIIFSVANDYAEGEHVDPKQFFERFYRKDESHNSKVGGYGIGLSILKEAAALMKCKLDVRWKDGKIIFSLAFSQS